MTLDGTLGLCLLFRKGLGAHHSNITKDLLLGDFVSIAGQFSDPPAC